MREKLRENTIKIPSHLQNVYQGRIETKIKNKYPVIENF